MLSLGERGRTDRPGNGRPGVGHHDTDRRQSWAQNFMVLHCFFVAPPPAPHSDHVLEVSCLPIATGFGSALYPTINGLQRQHDPSRLQVHTLPVFRAAFQELPDDVLLEPQPVSTCSSTTPSTNYAMYVQRHKSPKTQSLEL